MSLFLVDASESIDGVGDFFQVEDMGVF